MADTRQHQVHEQKLEQLVKIMPFYIGEYVDDKLCSLSPSTERGIGKLFTLVKKP